MGEKSIRWNLSIVVIQILVHLWAVGITVRGPRHLKVAQKNTRLRPRLKGCWGVPLRIISLPNCFLIFLSGVWLRYKECDQHRNKWVRWNGTGLSGWWCWHCPYPQLSVPHVGVAHSSYPRLAAMTMTQTRINLKEAPPRLWAQFCLSWKKYFGHGKLFFLVFEENVNVNVNRVEMHSWAQRILCLCKILAHDSKALRTPNGNRSSGCILCSSSINLHEIIGELVEIIKFYFFI